MDEMATVGRLFCSSHSSTQIILLFFICNDSACHPRGEDGETNLEYHSPIVKLHALQLSKTKSDDSTQREECKMRRKICGCGC